MALYRRTDFVLDQEGRGVSGALVTVIDPNTGAPASIFSDDAGLVPLANPFVSDPTGKFSYVAQAGIYRETVSRPGYYDDTTEGVVVGVLVGPQGEAGPQGPQGERGPSGAPGADLSAANNWAAMQNFQYGLLAPVILDLNQIQGENLDIFGVQSVEIGPGGAALYDNGAGQLGINAPGGVLLDGTDLDVHGTIAQDGMPILPAFADTADPLKNAGMVGFNAALAYAANTVGDALKTCLAFITNLAASFGSSLVGFLQSGTGAVARTVQDKGREWVSVKDFGAVGDGVTDDSAKIALALAASQRVFFPKGQYRISAPIDWTNQWLRGEVDNGTFSTATNQTMILPDGDFPAFRYHHPSGYSSQGGGIENFNIYYGASAPVAENNKAGVFIDSTGGYPAFHTIKNLTVRGASWAIRDLSGSWMATWEKINGENNFGGFYKSGGTALSMKHCYHRGGFAGIVIVDVLGVSIDACAVDLCSSVYGVGPLQISNSNVIINGCDFEANVLDGDYRSIVGITNNSVVTMNGVRFLNPDIKATATELYMIKVDSGSKLVMDSVDFRTPTYAGAGGVLAYVVSTGSSSVSINGMLAPAITGAPSFTYAFIGTTGDIDYNSVTTPYTSIGKNYRNAKCLQSVQSHTYGAVASGSYEAVAWSVPGAALGDIVSIASTADLPIGTFLTANVSATDTVRATFVNVSGSSKTLGATTHNISVNK